MAIADQARKDGVTGCIGKEAYRTPGLAHQVLKRRGKCDRQRRKLEIYRCTVCGSWHMGNPNR